MGLSSRKAATLSSYTQEPAGFPSPAEGKGDPSGGASIGNAATVGGR